MVQSSRPSIQIDLNEFKLHLHLKSRSQLTLHFDSPSRSYYLSVIALVVHEMKKLGKIKCIPLQEHLNLLALLNETIGGAAGSSEEENLLHRIYRKWKDALPNLEEAPLFKVLGKKKKEAGDGTTGKIYSFTDAEKDEWANLFEYMGSNENVKLKFAIDKIGVALNETSIIFGDSLNGDAWDQFISGLKNGSKEKSEPVRETAVAEPSAAPFSSPQERKISLPDWPSIAVLPFVNMSEDPKQEYFSDGITEDLITDLSKISGLLVIARDSTFTYKGKAVKVRQVAEELGVRYVLEGSVRRAGDEIRINAQLVDALTGRHVWADRYDGTMGQIFALQDQITQRIVSSLAVKLTGDEKEQVGQKGTDNITAYEAFLEGWDHYNRLTADGFEKAAAFFKKSIELDPNYGQAYAALAIVHMQAASFHAFLPGLKICWQEARLRAGEYTRMAMKKPTAPAYAASSAMYLIRRQHKEEISELERGLALDPNSICCHGRMGWTLIMAGRPKEGIAYLNKRMRLDPRGRYMYLSARSYAHFCMGEIAEAAQLLEQAMRLNPEEKGGPMALLAACYSMLGRVQDARAILDFRRKNPMAECNVADSMFQVPLKDRAVADRFADGLIKAGLPPGKIAGGYFPAFKENQLTGEEIKRLTSGAKVTGIGGDGQQWWVDFKKNGELAWRQAGGPISPDRGKNWIEGDNLCLQFQKLFWGLEYYQTVFRNPRGTYEGKDEYFSCTDIGFKPFSLVK